MRVATCASVDDSLGACPDHVFEEQELTNSPLPRLLKRFVKFLLLALIITFIVLISVRRREVGFAISSMLLFMIDHPFLGALCFVAIYTINAILTLPVFILVLGAGFVSERAFGVSGIGIACIEVFVASVVSSSSAFFLARHLCLNHVRVWTAKSKNLKLVEALMKKKGFRIVLMLRLASVLPFGTLNYVISVLSVSYSSFLLGSIGLLPYIITYVMIGSSLGSISQVVSGETGTSTQGLVLLIIGASVAFFASLYISLMARRTLVTLEKREHRRASLVSIRQSQILMIAGEGAAATGSTGSTERKEDDMTEQPISYMQNSKTHGLMKAFSKASNNMSMMCRFNDEYYVSAGKTPLNG